MNWVPAGLEIAFFRARIAKLPAVDGDALPTAQPVDSVTFPSATALRAYLTRRAFGTCSAGFRLFWIICF